MLVFTYLFKNKTTLSWCFISLLSRNKRFFWQKMCTFSWNMSFASNVTNFFGQGDLLQNYQAEKQIVITWIWTYLLTLQFFSPQIFVINVRCMIEIAPICWLRNSPYPNSLWLNGHTERLIWIFKKNFITFPFTPLPPSKLSPILGGIV